MYAQDLETDQGPEYILSDYISNIVRMFFLKQSISVLT